MFRKSSDRISDNDNQQGKTKAMFAVEAFGPKDADQMARKMLERESRGYGDQLNAYQKVAERCGVTARQLRRFLSGEIKRPDFDLIQGIRVGWINLWEEQIRKMQADLDIQKARFGSDHFTDLEADVQALASKIETAKARTKRK